jgi:pyridoxal phosphate phosphatase PHOSPHO2
MIMSKIPYFLLFTVIGILTNFTAFGMDNIVSEMHSEGMSQKKITIIWDFDWTIVDDNTDEFVPAELDNGLYKQMDHLGKTLELEWTELVQEIVFRLNEQGFKQEAFQGVLARIPLEKEMIQAIGLAKQKGSVQHIVSDANTFFIESILTSYHIRDSFSEIHTNPSYWEDNKLIIARYHNNHLRPKQYLEHTRNEVKLHSCKNCPVNMCKGDIVKNLPIDKDGLVIYIGDGGGDYCPITLLKNSDIALVRIGKNHRWGQEFSLLKKIERIGNVNAKIQTWKNGGDLLQIFETLFK